jgi:uncharacterized damage-inducible protein DinB
MEKTLQDLAAHLRWADAIAFHALGKCPAALAEPDVRERLHHAAFVAGAFATLLEGGEVIYPKDEIPPFETLRAMTQAAGDRLEAWARSGADLERPIRVGWFSDPPLTLPAREAFLQAILHTQHHRAQTMTRLKQMGGKAVNVDFILWIWKQRPEPRWP